jgi:lysophospholipase L1-like esterase
MKKVLLLSLIALSALSVSAQSYPVTLKVIDHTAGAITNNVDDNNETNIICWLSDALSAQNPRTPSDWWYPMYHDNGVSSPNGLLVKNPDSWEWTLTLQATAGTYEWNIIAKTLGWGDINPDMYAYVGDNGNNLIFTVGADGTVGGHTELVIPDPNAQTRYPVTLKVIDYTAGALSDAPGTWAYDANIITWVSGDLNDGAYWFYGMFDRQVDWDGAGNNFVTFPRGQLIKEADKWTWQVTFDAAAGAYQWNPMSILHGYASLNGYGGAYWEGENLQFGVMADGEITGQYIVELGRPIDIPEGTIRIAAIGDSNTAGAGASNAGQYAWSVQLGNLLGNDYFAYNFGVSGATLMNFPEPWGAWTNNKDNAYNLYKTYNADIVLIALGTNDSKTGYWNNGHDFQVEYNDFIANVKSFAAANADVYMILPIHAINTNFDIQPTNIETGVVPQINQLSLEKGINVIDWYSLTSAWTAAQLPDGIHANDAALGVMAQKVYDILQTSKPAILQNDGTKTPVDADYAEYRWYKDGALISNGVAQYSFNATAAGTYKVAVKLNANADDVLVSDEITISQPVELYLKDNGTITLTESDNAQSFSIFPNPVADELRITNYKVRNGDEIEIYNISGRKINNSQFSTLNSDLKIDVSTLSAGIYFVKVGGNIAKFVKE